VKSETRLWGLAWVRPATMMKRMMVTWMMLATVLNRDVALVERTAARQTAEQMTTAMGSRWP